MNSKIVFGLFILILLPTACISEYDPVLPSDDRKILFIDGSIIADRISTFYITQSFSLNGNTVPEESFVNNANLIIIGSNGYKSQPAKNMGKGTYQIAVGNLDDNVEYGLQIEYDSETYQSELSKPLYTPEIDTLYWVQPEPLAGVSFYLSTHDDTDKARFFLWNYTEDWEINVKFEVSIFYNPDADEFTYSPLSSNLFYYGWKKQEASLLGSTETLHESKIIDQLLYHLEPEGDRFMTLYCVTVTQKVISQGAYEYYQQVKKQNEEMGGLFTPQPAELAGNIKCVTNPSKKALGYVETLKNISQKRMFVRPGVWPNPLIWPQKQRWQYEDYCEENKYSNDYLRGLGFSYRGLYHNLKYRPLYAITEPHFDIGAWAPATCTDCREYGATKNRPDFWPNDHW